MHSSSGCGEKIMASGGSADIPGRSWIFCERPNGSSTPAAQKPHWFGNRFLERIHKFNRH